MCVCPVNYLSGFSTSSGSAWQRWLSCSRACESSPQTIVDALSQDDLVPVPGFSHGRMHRAEAVAPPHCAASERSPELYSKAVLATLSWHTFPINAMQRAITANTLCSGMLALHYHHQLQYSQEWTHGCEVQKLSASRRGFSLQFVPAHQSPGGSWGHPPPEPGAALAQTALAETLLLAASAEVLHPQGCPDQDPRAPPCLARLPLQHPSPARAAMCLHLRDVQLTAVHRR